MSFSALQLFIDFMPALMLQFWKVTDSPDQRCSSDPLVPFLRYLYPVMAHFSVHL